MNPVVIGIIVVAVALVALFVVLGPLKTARDNKRLTASKCGEVPHPGGTMDPEAWFTGPPLPADQGGTKSPGMPLHPPADANGGLVFDIPVEPFGLSPSSKLDSSAFCHGPLTGKKLIRLRYRYDPTDADNGAYSVPETPGADKYRPRLTPFFQEKGDNDTAAGKYEWERWFHDLSGDLHYLEPGEHEIVATFDAGWGATQRSTQADNPERFKEAFDNCCCLGFVVGGNEVGLGHGICTIAPARLTILGFTTE